jgi:hypothetical protein
VVDSLLENEVFKPYPKNTDYLISNKGRVYSNKTNRFIKQTLNRGGYFWVNISCPQTYGKAKRIHRLVAETFLGESPEGKPDINHIDGNKTNNNVENLEWSNKSLNGKHAYKIGLRGVNCLIEDEHPMRIINSDIAREIKRLILTGLTKTDIAKKFNIKPNIVYSIASNKTWKTVTIEEN